MNYLTDQQLLSAIENLVTREREILNDVLRHLQEIDRRKLFSKLGFTSLFDYATKQLKYSPDQAGRRIAAMRLLREVPEAESKVVNGSLTLSALAQAHWHFNKVEHTREEKRQVLVKLENASKKETKAILQQEDTVRYSFEADQSLETVIEELRGLHPHLSFDQLNKKVWEIAYEKLHPSKKIERNELSIVKKEKTQTAHAIAESAAARSFTSAGKVSRYIPADVKRLVWSKAGGKCERCESKFALEYDHIVPFAKGGANAPENLRLLCRSCNQRKGIEQYGIKKMNQFREAHQQ